MADSAETPGTDPAGKAPPADESAAPATPRRIRAWSRESSSSSTSPTTSSDTLSDEEVVARTHDCPHAGVDPVAGTEYVVCRTCGLLLRPSA